MRRLHSLTLALPLVASGAASADVIFVNANQALPLGFQTGGSWAFAYKSLQQALGTVVAGDAIYVAAGTYKPTATTDRTASFVIPNGVKVYGGFVAGGAFDERDPLSNPTILSGEIGGASNADNSFHVVRFEAVDDSTVLSGFAITGGNANGPGTDDFGGGIRSNGSPIVVDCRLFGNNASSSGGGAFSVHFGDAPMLFSNCTFVGNTSNGTGAAAEIQNGAARFFFCTIVNNVSIGGPSGGLRFLNAGTASTIASCIIRDNVGTAAAPASQVTTVNSTVFINTSNITGGLGSNAVNADPLFVDRDGADGLIGTIDDKLALRGSSPCIDRGSTSNIPSDAADLDGDGITNEQLSLDLGGSPRRVEDFLVPNGPGALTPAPDIGAFEFARPRTILVDKDATGANTGVNWTDAYTNLQSAIQELNDVKFGGPGEIWVAEGTYKPTTSTNQTISFVLPFQGQMYGGFAGGEVERSQRDWVAHPTILSGEIGNQSATFDNTDTVVLANGATYGNDTVLDGFIVTRGADGPAGGIHCLNNASPTIRNCRIVDNVNGVKFTGNSAAKPVLDNCIVHGNLNFGVDYTFTDARITSCTVAFNTSAGFNSGAGIRGDGSDGEIRSCLVFGNVGNGLTGQPAQIGKPSGDGIINAVISCCAIQGFNGSFPNDVNCFPIGSDGGVVDANGADNVAGTIDDDFSVAACSDLVDAGDNTVSYADVLDYDDDGNTAEALNEDFAGGIRNVDLPVGNTGLGAGAIDVGAFEKQALGLPDADLNDDGVVDGADLGILLGAWGTSSELADLNVDCIVNGADLAILLGAWS
ncbi:MAG: right-handed parallel beta-helix repeat-containing protein [Phycisphaerae bacterium]|nr:right-handed parallel beta-helix repeat-containing protein [Phycisphaerae bacterium]